MQYPKFDAKLKQNVIQPQAKQKALSGYGMIAQYDPKTNTALVVMATRGSDDPGEVFKNVPCPVIMGANFTAPEPGRPCWVDFKDDNHGFPFVTAYFNSNYASIDYSRQTNAADNTPKYIYNM